jgi:L-amino acid N-acyltransferase YncA
MTVAAAADGQRAERVMTRDGVQIAIRPIAPEDRGRLRAAFEHLGPETRYRRFLSPVEHLSERELSRLTVVDHHDHEALVALDRAGELVGVARYIRLEDRSSVAEVAVTVADDWQGRGVGTALLSRLITRAKSAGIATFVASCLAYNEEMLTLFRDLGRSVRRTGSGAGVVEIEVELPADEEALRPALRAVAGAEPRRTPGRASPDGGDGERADRHSDQGDHERRGE